MQFKYVRILFIFYKTGSNLDQDRTDVCKQ